jgi:hypothetical protein
MSDDDAVRIFLGGEPLDHSARRQIYYRQRISEILSSVKRTPVT